MSEPQEITIELSSRRVAARVWGPDDGVPVLALHGWLDNAATFDGIAPRLPGLRLVCLDMPGHGKSDHRPPGELYSFIDSVADAHEVTLALGWDRFALIGHSLGAAIVTVLAGAVPAKVTSVVAIEGLGPVAEAADHAAERLGRSLKEEQRQRQFRPNPVYETPVQMAKMLQRTLSTLSFQSAQTLIDRGCRSVEGGYTWRSDPRLRIASRIRLTEEQVLAFLRAIEAPVLLVRGTEGFAFTPKDGSPRVGAVRALSVIELEGGHHLHLDSPQPVADAISRHLARLFDERQKP